VNEKKRAVLVSIGQRSDESCDWTQQRGHGGHGDEEERKQIEDVGWQTQERIAWKYMECQFICWVSFEWSGKVLKRQGVEELVSGVQGMGMRAGKRKSQNPHASKTEACGTRHLSGNATNQALRREIAN
jgi:hypothetical protein